MNFQDWLEYPFLITDKKKTGGTYLETLYAWIERDPETFLNQER
jgi:hypothetical protein